MTVYRNEERYDRSNAVFENGRVILYDKHARDPKMSYIDYGLNLMSRAAFEAAPEGAFDLAGLLSGLAFSGNLSGYEVRERFYEIGSPEGLEDTRRYLEGKAEQIR
jgi:NDP-sugar pyrophosphorylase family protein